MDSLIESAETVSLFCRTYATVKRELPIRASEMGLLIYAARSGTPVTSVQAASFFMVSKPMIAAMVRVLERRGYLTRGEDQKDRRRFILRPTASGLALVEETYAEYLKTIRLLREKMGEEDFGGLVRYLVQANEILIGERT